MLRDYCVSTAARNLRVWSKMTLALHLFGYFAVGFVVVAACMAERAVVNWFHQRLDGDGE